MKLSERFINAVDEDSIISGKNAHAIEDAVNFIRKYEDAEEQGRLVILPCKVGDTVWSRDVEPWTVVSVEWFSRRVTQLHCKSPVTGRGMTFSVGKRSLGKTVFLTREEAEATLKGGQHDAQ